MIKIVTFCTYRCFLLVLHFDKIATVRKKMQLVHSFIFWLHILFGSMALILFWFPMFYKKGSFDHIKFGQHYVKIMYIVAATGALMATLVIGFPITIKSDLISQAKNTEQAILNIRVFWSFLLYLSLLTFVSVRHGVLVVKDKTRHSSIRDGLHLVVITLLLVGGLVMLVVGYKLSFILYQIFGLLGTVLAFRMGRFCLAKSVNQQQWLSQHISAFVGSGIGAYTAFLAFGARRLTDDLGSLQVVFWVAPGVIGGVASWYLSRKYQSGLVVNRNQK
jgi:hypothetical protein